MNAKTTQKLFVKAIVLVFFLISANQAFANSEYIYVCDREAGVVHKLTTEGSYVTSIGQTILNSPISCIFDSKGNLIVTDDSNLKVFQHDTYYTTFGDGWFDNLTGFARHLAVDSEGNIYVTGYSNGLIEVFDSDYQHIDTFDYTGTLGSRILPQGTIYEGPVGIAFDHLTENLIFTTFWAPSGDQGQFEIETDGSIVEEFGLSWYSDYTCKINSDGILFIDDATSGIKGIRVYDQDRTQIKIWLQNDVIGGGNIGISFDKSGNIYVTVDNNTIEVYENYDTETPIRTITNPNFDNIRGIAIIEEYDTTFRPSSDGFGFINWGVGHCTGMSYAAMYYFLLDIDPKQCLEVPEKRDKQRRYIEILQWHRPYYWYGAAIHASWKVYPQTSQKLEDAYNHIVYTIFDEDRPCPIFIGSTLGSEPHGHCLLAYKVLDMGHSKIIFVYDSNIGGEDPYNPGDAFPDSLKNGARIVLRVQDSQWTMDRFQVTYEGDNLYDEHYTQMAPVFPNYLKRDLRLGKALN